MYVCLCRAVTDRSVQQAIEGGARGVRDVAWRSGAGTMCGGCRPAILALLAEHVGHGSRGDATVTTIGGEVEPIQDEAAEGSH